MSQMLKRACELTAAKSNRMWHSQGKTNRKEMHHSICNSWKLWYSHFFITFDHLTWKVLPFFSCFHMYWRHASKEMVQVRGWRHFHHQKDRHGTLLGTPELAEWKDQFYHGKWKGSFFTLRGRSFHEADGWNAEKESFSKTHAYEQIRAIRFAPPHINKEMCDNWAREQSSADLQRPATA